MRYRVTAARGEEALTELAIEAPGPEAARVAAAARGYAVIAVRAAGGPLVELAARVRARERFPATVFAVELLALVRAGLNAAEAVRALAAAHARSPHAGAYARIEHALNAGQRLSVALEHAAPEIPPLLVASLRAAERTSDLEAALARYVDYAKRVEAVQRQVRTVLIYPAILLAVGFAVTGFLLLYVVPRFASIYEEVSGEIPFFSALLLAAGRWVGQHPLGVAMLLVAVLGALVWAVADPRLRARLTAGRWLPAAWRERVRELHVARLYRSLGMLLRSGIPLLEALAMSAALLPAALRVAAAQAAERLRAGLPVSAALAGAKLSTPIAAEMLAVGERSGELAAMLDRIADFHDEALGRWLDTAMRVFEPVLMTVLGVLIGAIVVLMYMPIFELAAGLE